MKLAKQVLRRFNEALDDSDYELIADVMHNDENSSDEEVIELIADEVNVDKDKVKVFVEKERSNFLGPAYMKNKIVDDIKVIKKYL